MKLKSKPKQKCSCQPVHALWIAIACGFRVHPVHSTWLKSQEYFAQSDCSGRLEAFTLQQHPQAQCSQQQSVTCVDATKTICGGSNVNNFSSATSGALSWLVVERMTMVQGNCVSLEATKEQQDHQQPIQFLVVRADSSCVAATADLSRTLSAFFAEHTRLSSQVVSFRASTHDVDVAEYLDGKQTRTGMLKIFSDIQCQKEIHSFEGLFGQCLSNQLLRFDREVAFLQAVNLASNLPIRLSNDSSKSGSVDAVHSQSGHSSGDGLHAPNNGRINKSGHNGSVHIELDPLKASVLGMAFAFLAGLFILGVGIITWKRKHDEREARAAAQAATTPVTPEWPFANANDADDPEHHQTHREHSSSTPQPDWKTCVGPV